MRRRETESDQMFVLSFLWLEKYDRRDAEFDSNLDPCKNWSIWANWEWSIKWSTSEQIDIRTLFYLLMINRIHIFYAGNAHTDTTVKTKIKICGYYIFLIVGSSLLYLLSTIYLPWIKVEIVCSSPMFNQNYFSLFWALRSFTVPINDTESQRKSAWNFVYSFLFKLKIDRFPLIGSIWTNSERMFTVRVHSILKMGRKRANCCETAHKCTPPLTMECTFLIMTAL